MLTALKLARRWRSNESGLAAIEFAFVLPILLTMLLGLVELSNALGTRTALTNMASTAADLIARESATSGSDMDTVFGAMSAMMYGYSTSSATVTITSVIDGGAGKPPVVSWSCAWNASGSSASPQAKGATPTVPSGMVTQGGGDSVIWARVTYIYTSPLSAFITSPISWSNDFYLKPRRVLQIPYSTPAPSSSGAQCNS
ncbi:MAG TPA: TadE/TadG family type IV pilus assembly protein [Rhizomicrobium sp.]|jgi:Flp pilus assembly protein TadG|nr:TadE/TadG family type IV pilus assembly protein [Rhizomicrobium sp.]